MTTNMSRRPKIIIELTLTDKVIEILGWLALAILWTLTLLAFTDLPETIPTHYNGAGLVDNYGDKSTIFILPIIGTLIFVLMTILNRFPHIFNYPTIITAENAEKQYILATRLIRYLKFAIVVIFLVIALMTIWTTNNKSEGLGPWFLPLFLGLVFIPVIVFIIKSVKTK